MFCDSGTKTCAAAPRLKNPGETCNTDDDCVTIDSSGADLGQTVCGCPVNNVGKDSYCVVQAGDLKAVNFKNNFRKYVLPYLINTVGKCNTDARLRLPCWTAYQTSEEAIKSLSGTVVYDSLAMSNYGFSAANVDAAIL